MMYEKYRHEMKYIISQGQLTMLQQRLNGLMALDPHVGPSGQYQIRSVYFDDCNRRCFYENLAGVDPREKFRIRIYNHSMDRINLECKRKERGKTLKTSCSLTLEQCRKLLNGQPLPDIAEQKPVTRRLTIEMLQHRMQPVVIVEYDRIPYVYPLGNVRITLDLNISSSLAIGNFFEEKLPKRPVMPAGQHLLEVKYDEFLPDFIYRALQLDSLQQTSFSKYFLCQQYALR